MHGCCQHQNAVNAGVQLAEPTDIMLHMSALTSVMPAKQEDWGLVVARLTSTSGETGRLYLSVALFEFVTAGHLRLR